MAVDLQNEIGEAQVRDRPAAAVDHADVDLDGVGRRLEALRASRSLSGLQHGEAGESERDG
jgi:hypothetical protein